MKKNRTMRMAGILCLVLLLTTSIIGGTLAKYTTQDLGSDAARIGKWGVELQVAGNLYGDSYKDVIVKDTDSTITVQSVNKTDDIVAPGTKNEQGFTFSLKGKPEVDGSVTTTMKIQNTFLAAGNWGIMIPVDDGLVTAENFDEYEQDLYTLSNGIYTKATAYTAVPYYTLEDAVAVSDDYYPVVYTLSGNTSNTSADNEDSLKEAADLIANAMGLTAAASTTDNSITYTGTKTFDSNTDLASWKVDGLTLTWAWAFSDGTVSGNAATENDKADTILGLLENVTEGAVVKASGSDYVAPTEYTDYSLDTCFEIDIVATQAD